MYPVLFRIGQFEITSFGVLVAIGALVGMWIFGRELRRSGLPDDAVDCGFAGVIGGMVGAKLLWVMEHAGSGPLSDLLWSRSGMSWFGGLAGGLLAGIAMIRRRRLPAMAVVSAAAPALVVGHAIGRVGCFLVGDDYGWATDLPWGVAFPEGLPPTTVPVHPTQLYEALALVPLALLLLRWRRQGRPDHVVVGGYLMLAGAIRFGIEFVRVHEPVFGGLAVAHLAALLAVLAGTVVLYAGGTRAAGAVNMRSR